MKEFVVYTGLRLGLFLATWAIVVGLWLLVTGSASAGLTFLVALVLSGVGSYWVLRGPREAFAQRVQTRAEAATARFEEMRAKEDAE